KLCTEGENSERAHRARPWGDLKYNDPDLRRIVARRRPAWPEEENEPMLRAYCATTAPRNWRMPPAGSSSRTRYVPLGRSQRCITTGALGSLFVRRASRP